MEISILGLKTITNIYVIPMSPTYVIIKRTIIVRTGKSKILYLVSPAAWYGLSKP